jgi:TetR/AcrR family transcriptional regulator, acrAB operon repressor
MYEVGVESRRRILDAAEELIAERGFEKTSIVEISKRSGVSRGSIPWHFTNKDGILLAVIDRVTSRYFAEEAFEEGQAMPSTHDVLARFAELTRGDGARLLFAALNQAVSATGPVRAQYQEFFAGERMKIDAWLEFVGIPTERRKPLAAAILSSLLGSTLQWLVDPDDVDLDQTVRAVADMIEDHLPRR